MRRDVGFFHLIGHGIPDEVTAHAFAEAERFFALPLPDKQQVEMLHSPHFRGYTRTGGELTQDHIDWREQIDIGADREPLRDAAAPAYMRLEGPNLWPAAQPELQAVITEWQSRCSAVAMRLMQSLALALGSPADVFDRTFGDRSSTLIKLIRYPGQKSAVVAVPSNLSEDEIKAVVVPWVGATIDPVELTEFLAERLPYFMVPRYVETVDGLPKTPTQKVHKHVLRGSGVGEHVWDREAAGIVLRRRGR